MSSSARCVSQPASLASRRRRRPSGPLSSGDDDDDDDGRRWNCLSSCHHGCECECLEGGLFAFRARPGEEGGTWVIDGLDCHVIITDHVRPMRGKQQPRGESHIRSPYSQCYERTASNPRDQRPQTKQPSPSCLSLLQSTFQNG
jgi:hypothetical protein